MGTTCRPVRAAYVLLAALPGLFAALTGPAVCRPSQSEPAAIPPEGQGVVRSDYRLKINVDLVTIDAVVRDRRGAFVRDLRAGDFAVYDNDIPRRISHFSHDRVALAVALLIDCSPSVAKYLPDLKDAARSALQRLAPEDQVVLFSFDQCPARQTQLSEDRVEIARRIGGLRLGIGTNICDAVVAASRYLRENALERRRAIILFSDNHANIARFTDREALEEALESSVTLYSIRTPGENSGFPSSSDRRAMPPPFLFTGPADIEHLAKETGGEVLKLGGKDKLAAALETAVANLRQQYTLGFTPDDGDIERNFHKLAVYLNPERPCPGCSVQARTGYFTQPSHAGPATGFPAGLQPYDCMGLGALAEEARLRQLIHGLSESPHQLTLLGFTAEAVASSGDGEEPQIEVGLAIDPRQVLFRTAASRYTASLRVTVFYGDSHGREIGADWQILEVNAAAEEYRRLLQSGIAFRTVIPLVAPGQVLKVVVYDPAGGKAGTRLIRIE